MSEGGADIDRRPGGESRNRAVNRKDSRANQSSMTTEDDTPPPRSRGTGSATQGGTAAAGSSNGAGASADSSSSSTGRSSFLAAFEWLMMLILVLYVCHVVVEYQSDRLPEPRDLDKAGIHGFSEDTAMDYVKSLTQFGPHPVGSDALLKALVFVYSQLTLIKDSSDPGVDMEVDLFESSPGLVRLQGGTFKGRSLVYSNLKHLVVRLSPEAFPEAKENAILVSSHVDSVVTSPGAGDCSSCVAVMLEVLRALSNWASGFKHSVIFLFNTGEEEGLLGAHSFMTQHSWRDTIRAAIDVEAMGVGGRSTLFQAGPDKFLLNLYAKHAKYPSAQVVAQDVFYLGLVNAATDFQVYREVAGLSGLDFAYLENSAVYHTRNDRIEFLRPGSLQALGDDLLEVLKAAVLSDNLAFVGRSNVSKGVEKMDMVYFDILGKWMITYPASASKAHQLSFVAQAFLLLAVSLYLSGSSAVVEFGLSQLTLLLMWGFSLTYVLVVAAVLPHISPFPIPYIAHPWLVLGLFGAPALFGALLGHGLGKLLLVKYIKQRGVPNGEEQWLAERWLFKAGICQWVLVLGLGSYIGAGSTYIPLFWIVPAVLNFGLLEAQFSSRQRLRGLLRLTFWLSALPGIVISATPAVRLSTVLVSNLVKFERNPGSVGPWVANAVAGVLVAGICCLMLAYLLPYAHRSGGLLPILLSITAIFVGAVLLVTTEVTPAFTEDVSRAVQAVHVVDSTTARLKNSELPQQYISIFSITPGKLEKELEFLNDSSFTCGESSLDTATFVVRYSCTKPLEQDVSLLEGQPRLEFDKDRFLRGHRISVVNFSSGHAYRWSIAINTTAIGSFKMKGFKAKKDAEADEEMVLIPRGDVIGVDGWHYIQFTSDVEGPTTFQLILYWHSESQGEADLKLGREALILKARTDINTITPQLDAVLKAFPPWCSLFGKSTSPYNLAYITDLKVPVSS